MSAQKKGLGKGLSALFGEIENKIDNKSNQKNTIAISDLERNKYQPRIIFDEADSIKIPSCNITGSDIPPIGVLNIFDLNFCEISFSFNQPRSPPLTAVCEILSLIAVLSKPSTSIFPFISFI